MKSTAVRIAKIGIAGCGILTLFDTVGFPAGVSGNSMYPTLQGSDSRWWMRDFVWLSRWNLDNCNNGTILTFKCPADPETIHIKRVSLVEGQYAKHREFLTEVPKGNYWMEGDNPVNGNDSNIYGPVSSGLVTGRAVSIIWPPNRWQLL